MKNSDLNISAGEIVRKLRGPRTQSEMAETAGITQGQWCKLEKGVIPKTETMGKVAKTLGLSIERILYGDEAALPPPAPPPKEPAGIADGSACYLNALALTPTEHRLLTAFRSLDTGQQGLMLKVMEAEAQESRAKDGGGSMTDFFCTKHLLDRG